MRLDSFRLQNYMCFSDTGLLTFGPRFNTVVGVNSAGKSVLTDALRFVIDRRPTRSPRTQPHPDDALNPESSIEATITTSGLELRRALIRESNSFSVLVPSRLNEEDARVKYLEEMLIRTELTFTCGISTAIGFEGQESPIQITSNSQLRANFIARPDKSTFNSPGIGVGINRNLTIGALVANYYRGSTFKFDADRLKVSRSFLSNDANLSPNAANLPSVLNIMQSDRALFSEYNKLVSQILPTVDHVSVIPVSNQEVEILVWPTPTHSHLAMPLKDCGTGVAQVLALLYVAVKSIQPGLTIIDEPNTFLHPAATRKLLETLGTFSNQQYIITTHSPEVIKAMVPDTLKRIEWRNCESTIVNMDVAEIRSMEMVLREIGARATDVMAADNIIWVDGESEEMVFPIILRELARKRMFGTAFVAIRDTDRFEKSAFDMGAIPRLYEKLSKGGGYVPRAIGFSLDREARSTETVKELCSRYPNMFFLERRMLENYFLDAGAIAHVINLQLSRPETVEAGVVTEWIQKHGAQNKYFNPLPIQTEIGGVEWMNTVHAGKLLHDLMSDISGAKAVFVKTRDDPEIVSWMISNAKEKLKPLSDHIEAVVGKSGAGFVDY
jgi:AAA ATPase domain/AAA domain